MKSDSSTIETQNSSAADIKSAYFTIANNGNSNVQCYLTPLTVDYLNDSCIVASLFSAAIPDREKTMQLYEFLNHQQTFSKPISTQSKLLHQPARFLQSFGTGQCDDASSVLCALALKAGLKARLYHLSGHIVAEIFYDDAWHMFDANNGIVIKNASGKILSIKEIEADPSIINRNRFANSASVTLAKYLLKKTVSSTADNKVDNWLLAADNDYNSIIGLAPHDSIAFATFTRAANSWKRWLNIRIDNPYSTEGVYYHSVQLSADDTCFISLPYAITSVDVKQKGIGEQKVYYSTDGVKWFFKGVLHDELNALTFDTKASAEVPFVFNYYLKFVSADESNSTAQINLVSHFTFSEKQFLSNYNKVLVVKSPGAGSVSSLSVRYTVN